MAKPPDTAGVPAGPVPPSALEREPDGGHSPPASGDHGGGRLDHYLGDREGRSKLLFFLWVISLVFTGIGFALMVWIWRNGGL